MGQETKIFLVIGAFLVIFAIIVDDAGTRNGLLAFAGIILVILIPLFLFDRINRWDHKKYDMGKNSKKKRITFTVQWLGPTTKTEKVVNLTSYKKTMALLENLSKKNVKYKVDVTYEQRGKSI